MKNKKLIWFRAYVDILWDDRLALVAFDDQRHFFMLLACKRLGVLDSDAPYLERRVAQKLGLQVTVLDEVRRRLVEVGLIDENFQPCAWARRQFESDSNGAERTRKYRAGVDRKRHSDNGVTSQRDKCDAIDSETESETESEPDTPPLARGSAEGERAPERAHARPAKRMPSGYVPSTQLRAWAATEAPLVDFTDALATIRDHEFKTAHVDWDAVFRNWLRRDQKAAEQRVHRVTRAPAQEPLFRDDDTTLDGIEL